MNHVNKRFSRNSKIFCFICFSFFMAITLTLKSSCCSKELEEQVEHETEVQSNIESIEITTKSLNDIPIHIFTYEKQSIYSGAIMMPPNQIKIEEVEQQTEQVETEKVDTPEPEEPTRENKIYYVLDEGYRCDLPVEYQDYLWELCKEYDVTEYYELFIAQMYHESSFEESIISKTNDYGLMQINQCNHSWLSEKLGNGDFLDPYNNMEAGVLIMSGFLQKYSDVHKALVCYNKGESAVINGTYSTSYSYGVISDMDKLIEIK